jgi:hypothetical protein
MGVEYTPVILLQTVIRSKYEKFIPIRREQGRWRGYIPYHKSAKAPNRGK